MKTANRCLWPGTDPMYLAYHDTEWGVPEHDPRALWEKLVLDGFQAGLAWITILRKRDAFREAFAGFDPEVVAAFGSSDVDRLLRNDGIVRHRGKIEATIGNARAFLKISETGDFSDLLWSYVDHAPLQGHYDDRALVPTKDALSAQISKDLQTLGFRFVGPTIVYAFMEACGLRNNHLTTCFRHGEVRALALPAS